MVVLPFGRAKTDESTSILAVPDQIQLVLLLVIVKTEGAGETFFVRGRYYSESHRKSAKLTENS